MAPRRTVHPKLSRLLARTSPALAVVALAAGTAGTTSASAAAFPAAAGKAGAAATAGLRPGPGGASVLDGHASPIAAPSARPAGGSGAPAARRAGREPRQIARSMFHHFRWSQQRQFRYLNWLWDAESGWNVRASNPSSGAYGIPQAVPGSRMASAGPHWQTSARTQIRWGLHYIQGRYGTPRRAWRHEVTFGWY